MEFGFWLFMLAMDLLTPASMIFLGRRFREKPPKTINGSHGYRTARSMRSQQAWDFAQDYCGQVWQRAGKWLLPLSLVAMLPVLGRDIETVGIWSLAVVGAQLVVMLLTIVPVERALKRNFDQMGKLRSK